MSSRALLERTAERERIEGLLADALAGEGKVALVEGPAGIGKTRLLELARELARGRFETLSARGSELERDFAFGAIRQLLEAAVADPARGGSRLTGSASAAAPVFALTDAPPSATGGSFATLHGLFWLVHDLAEERPLLLAVDDLQWCDAASLRAFAYLARRLDGARVLLLATLRTTDPGTDPALVGELAADPYAERLNPGPLGLDSVSALIRDRLGTPPGAGFARACLDATGGNPLLIDQLLGAMAGDGVVPGDAHIAEVRAIRSSAPSRSVRLRMRRLPPAATEIARAVAALDAAATPTTVAALTGLAPEAVAGATRALVRADLLRPDALAFTHPVVRDAVYADLTAVERELMHAAAACRLRDLGAAREQIAAQLLATGPLGERWAGELMLMIGRATAAAGAFAESAPFFDRALREPHDAADEGRMRYELGLAEAHATRPVAREHLRAAYDALKDPNDRALTAVSLLRFLMVSGDAAGVRAFVAEMGADLREADEDLRHQLKALELLGAHLGYVPRRRLDETVAFRRLPDAPRLGDLMLAAFASLVWTLEGGTAEQCTRLADATLADGRLFANSNAVMVPTAMTAMIYADAEKATEHLDRCLATAREHGSPREVAVARTWRGMALLHRGELSEAGAELEGAREALAPLQVHAGTWTHLEAQMVALHTARGDLPAARAVLGAAHRGDEETDAMRMLRAAELELLIAEGDAANALAAAQTYGAIHARNTNPVWGRWRSVQARALSRLGRSKEALAPAQDELALARAYGAPGAIAYSLRELGLLTGGEAGVELLKEAVATAEGTSARLEHVRSLLALGKALRLARRPTEARSPLLRALEFAAAHGVDGVAADARTELAAAGVRPRREVFSGVDSLTPSERRVADLAAGGASNRDIAQALYVTPKTVEVHLTSAYRKLGLSSRRQLSGTLAT